MLRRPQPLKRHPLGRHQLGPIARQPVKRGVAVAFDGEYWVHGQL